MNGDSYVYFDDAYAHVVAVENEVSKCPTGTKFYGNLSSNFI